MLLKKIKRVTLTLAVLVCVVGVAILFYMLRPANIQTESPELAFLNSAKFRLANNPDDTAIVVERPLFWSERKPYVKPIEETPPKPKPKRLNNALDEVEVMGVFAAGLTSSVVLKKENGKTLRVALDEVYENWRLVEVTPSSALFIFDGTAQEGQPNTKEIFISRREPLPGEWQGKQQNLSESQ